MMSGGMLAWAAVAYPLAALGAVCVVTGSWIMVAAAINNPLRAQPSRLRRLWVLFVPGVVLLAPLVVFWAALAIGAR